LSEVKKKIISTILGNQCNVNSYHKRLGKTPLGYVKVTYDIVAFVFSPIRIKVESSEAISISPTIETFNVKLYNPSASESGGTDSVLRLFAASNRPIAVT